MTKVVDARKNIQVEMGIKTLLNLYLHLTKFNSKLASITKGVTGYLSVPIHFRHPW